MRFPVITSGSCQIQHTFVAHLRIDEYTLRLLDISGLDSSVFGGRIDIVYGKEVVDAFQITAMTDLFFSLVVDRCTDIGIHRPGVVFECLCYVQHDISIETAVFFADIVVASVSAGKLLDSGSITLVCRTHICLVIFQTSGDIDTFNDIPFQRGVGHETFLLVFADDAVHRPVRILQLHTLCFIRPVLFVNA